MDIPIRKGLRTLRRDGPAQFGYKTLNHLGMWLPIWNTITSRQAIGTNVFDSEWDLLVVLDTARVDVLSEVARTVPWLGPVDSVRSVGSMSAEWMVNTFQNSHADRIAETALVSANGWSDFILNERYHEHRNHSYEYLYPGHTRWDVVPPDGIRHHEVVLATDDTPLHLHPDSIRIPHVVTDRAISVGRTVQPERLIVHYNLPHLEHIAGALDWEYGILSTDALMDGPEPVRDLKPEEKSLDPGRAGDVSPDVYLDNHRRTLRLVLEYVEILLNNVDATDVVITADHGDAFGEHGTWGHPFGYPFAPVKTVPCAVTSGTDESTYDSRHGRVDRSQPDSDSTELLEQMGYI